MLWWEPAFMAFVCAVADYYLLGGSIDKGIAVMAFGFALSCMLILRSLRKP